MQSWTSNPSVLFRQNPTFQSENIVERLNSLAQFILIIGILTSIGLRSEFPLLFCGMCLFILFIVDSLLENEVKKEEQEQKHEEEKKTKGIILQPFRQDSVQWNYSDDDDDDDEFENAMTNINRSFCTTNNTECKKVAPDDDCTTYGSMVGRVSGQCERNNPPPKYTHSVLPPQQSQQIRFEAPPVTDNFFNDFKKIFQQEENPICNTMQEVQNQRLGGQSSQRVKNPSFQPMIISREVPQDAIVGWGFGREVGPMIAPTGFAQDFVPFPAMPLPSFQVASSGGPSVNDVAPGQPSSMFSRRKGIGLGLL